MHHTPAGPHYAVSALLDPLPVLLPIQLPLPVPREVRDPCLHRVCAISQDGLRERLRPTPEGLDGTASEGRRGVTSWDVSRWDGDGGREQEQQSGGH